MSSGSATRITTPVIVHTEVKSRLILSPIVANSNNIPCNSGRKPASNMSLKGMCQNSPDLFSNSPCKTPVVSSKRLSKVSRKSSGLVTPVKANRHSPLTPNNLAEMISWKLSIPSDSPARTKSKVSSMPADMNTPEFSRFQAEKYPDDLVSPSSSCLGSGLIDEDDLINRITQLAINKSPPRHSSKAHHKHETPSRSAVKRAGQLHRKPGLLKTPSRLAKKQSSYDRYIPNRSAMDMNTAQLNLSRMSFDNTTGSFPTVSFTVDSLGQAAETEHDALTYQYEMAKACGMAIDQRILNFREKSEKEVVPSHVSRPLRPKTTHAKHAPGIADDFYLNLLDWSANNTVAVALGSSVYLWNASSGSVNELCTIDDDNGIASVSWSQDGSHLAIGGFSGETQLWDVDTESRLRTLHDQPSRVGVLSWNREILSTGSQAGIISNHDVRIAQSRVSTLRGHEGDICGLKWSHDGSQLASGGNDNLVNIWDVRHSLPKFTKQDHTAAVKALSWCPWQSNLLASGGGTDDKKIMFWNTLTGEKKATIDTGSQITGLIWSKMYREIVSAHGFADNQLMIWKYPSLTKVVEIPNAHQSRILHTTMSPDGQVICSGAADENIKFWRVFAVDPKNMKLKTSGAKITDGKKGVTPDLGFLNIR